MNRSNLFAAGIKDHSRFPFEHRVDDWVRKLLIGGDPDFHDIIRALPGVYPTAALASLKRLYGKGLISSETFRMLETQAKKGDNFLDIDSDLPLPHPVNFEWRFTRQTADDILEIIRPYRSEASSQILYFGTPGVAYAALHQRNVEPGIFIGEDNAVTRLLAKKNIERDCPLKIKRCGEELEPEVASTVIIDPPWYMDFIEPMLMAATHSVRMGGNIQFAMPSVGTARSTYRQRRQIFELAERIGLDVDRVRQGFLRYKTPFFEANALQAAGLSAFADWRCGDLVTFVKRRSHPISLDTSSINTPIWREAAIGRMRLYIGIESSQGSASLHSIVPNDILPSVSRNHRLRHKANVWTSGNRMFHCDNTDLLFHAATFTHADLNTSPFKDTYKIFPEKFDELLKLRYKLRQLSIREAREERILRIGDYECETSLISRNLLTTSNTMPTG